MKFTICFPCAIVRRWSQRELLTHAIMLGKISLCGCAKKAIE